ncbi:hypothetical protein N665_1688s0004 [Sinapis alba]|nr:hypothetical protein N665_1688s0004 [Sinapis alba]
MSHIITILCVILTFILVPAELGYWVSHRGDTNAHNNFLVGTVLVLFGVIGLLYCAYKRYCVNDDDDIDNDHHDHVIINIKELAGVDPSVLLRSIPVVDFNSTNFEDGVECVVCLSELADGDKAKLLPSCKHWFHAHCIDVWLYWHATCPICRTRVRLFQINEASSGNLTCSDENSADMTAVV